jgi:hypothetical protein
MDYVKITLLSEYAKESPLESNMRTVVNFELPDQRAFIQE